MCFRSEPANICTSRKEFFLNRVIPIWNDLPQEVRGAKSLNCFKAGLDKMKLFMVYAFFGASTFWLYVLKWLFNCKFFYFYIKLIWFCDVNDEDCLSSL